MTTFHGNESCTVDAVVEAVVADVVVAGCLLPGHIVAGEFTDKLAGFFPFRGREKKQVSNFLVSDVVLCGYG